MVNLNKKITITFYKDLTNEECRLLGLAFFIPQFIAFVGCLTYPIWGG